MTSSVASRPGFLRWLVTAGDPATLVATFTTAAGSPVDLSGSTIAAACANWSTSHAGTATVGGASNNEVTVAFADAVTGQLSGRGWTWTLTVDGVTTLAGPLDVAQPGVAGVVGGDASAVVVVDDVRVAVTVTTAGGGAVDSVNGQTGVVVLAAADVGADPAGTAAGLVDDLSGVSNAATARSNLGLGNVDNTSDVNKPVSTAQQTALDGKAPLASPTFTGTVTVPDQSASDNSGKAANTKYVDTAAGLLVPKSLVDAKGDLIVGTAADTAARLAVGADGQVLTADSAQASGVKWAAPAGGGSVSTGPFSAPDYYGPVGAVQGSVTSPLTAAGKLCAAPLWLWTGTYTYIKIGYDYTSGSNQATVRLGLYDANGTNGYPGTVRLDAGTFTAGAPGGARSISISHSITTSGWYWVAALCDAYTSTPSFTGIHTGAFGGLGSDPGSPRTGSTNNVSCLLASGVTPGAMPATFPTSFLGNYGMPAIVMYRS